jgi:hypothetical protein
MSYQSQPPMADVIVQLNRNQVPARLMGRLGDEEVWRRGRVLFVVRAIPPDAPARLRRALHARREATLYGRCPLCGTNDTVTRWPTASAGTAATLHEDGCPAADQWLTPALARWMRSNR